MALNFSWSWRLDAVCRARLREGSAPLLTMWSNRLMSPFAATMLCRCSELSDDPMARSKPSSRRPVTVRLMSAPWSSNQSSVSRS